MRYAHCFLALKACLAALAAWLDTRLVPWSGTPPINIACYQAQSLLISRHTDTQHTANYTNACASKSKANRKMNVFYNCQVSLMRQTHSLPVQVQELLCQIFIIELV